MAAVPKDKKHLQQPAQPGFGISGMVPGMGRSDSVPAMYTPGEYVLPADTVKAVGKDNLDGLRAATALQSKSPIPAKVPLGFRPELFFSGGGDEEDAKRNAAMVGVAQAGAQPAAPAGPGLAATAFPNTTRAIGGAMDDARSAYQQGGLGAALGQSARVMGAPLIGLADDVATGAKTVLNPAAQALKTFATGDATPIGQDSQTQTTPATPVALTPTPGALTDVQRGGGNAPAMPDATPAPGAAAALQAMPGVYNHGRGQFSDSAEGMGFKPDFTGQPNAQNLAAADSRVALGFRPGAGVAAPGPGLGFGPGSQLERIQAPTVQHSGNSWQAANDLRNARVSASSITANGGRFDQTRKGQMSPQAATYAAMLETDQALQKAQPGMAKAALDANAGLQREGMQQTGATQRAGLGFQTDQQRLAMDKEKQGFANRAAGQSEQLRNTLLDPNATPEQRKQAQQSLMTLQGKERGPRWKTSVVPGGVDALGNKLPGYGLLTDEATGESKIIQPGQGGAGGATAVSTPQQLAALPSGAVYTGPDGKQYRKN